MAKQAVFLIGSDRLTYSLAVCLRRAGETVILKTADIQAALDYLSIYNKELLRDNSNLSIVTDYNLLENVLLVLAITEEDLDTKTNLIQEIESYVSEDTIIGINTESINLNLLQHYAQVPDRILGANWVDPVHTTSFLEIVANNTTNSASSEYLRNVALEKWNKDPYIIHDESGIRTQLMVAMMREAFYLVTNGYATVEDIDRACRNDAGYYMSFAGNLRYMDLMGTYAYGMVMRDLNRELANDTTVPEFFTSMIKNKEFGMDYGKGFYTYEAGEADKWKGLVDQFSVQIGRLIDKYPFNYK